MIASVEGVVGAITADSLVIDVGASRALVITYVAPVVALIAGIAVLSESPGVGTLIGLPLILGGSWLAAGGQLPARRRDFAAAGEPHGGPDTPLLEGGPERGDRVAA